MPNIERKLSDTNLDVIVINRYDLDNLYPDIGSGIEGTVYKYNDDYALKRFSLFRAVEYFYEKELTRKFEKIEKMAALKDASFCFPIGLFGFTDRFKEGCYMKLVQYKKGKKDFNYLISVRDFDEIIDFLIKADMAIRRAHDMNIIIGDLKEDNILIDLDDNPIFIDTDNYAFEDYDFDLVPFRSRVLDSRYGEGHSLKDNDIFVFTMMALKLITKNNNFSFLDQSEEYLEKLISNLEFSTEVKSGIRLILSDSHDKPYVGPVLKMMKK